MKRRSFIKTLGAVFAAPVALTIGPKVTQDTLNVDGYLDGVVWVHGVQPSKPSHGDMYVDPRAGNVLAWDASKSRWVEVQSAGA